MFKKILSGLISFRVLAILSLFIFFDLLYNFNLVKDLFNKNTNITYGGDGMLLEYFAETFRLRILSLHNPFGFFRGLIYPLGVSLNLQDIGFNNSLYFLIFRPFLTIHQSITLMILINFFLAEVFMFLLLRLLKVPWLLSLIFALSFAFSPAFVFRIRGHFHFLYHFLYPLVVWLFLSITQAHQKPKLILYSILLGISFGLLFFSSGYLLVMFGLAILFWVVFSYFIDQAKLIDWIILVGSKIKYLTLSLIVFIIIISPLMWALVTSNPLMETRPSLDFGGARAYGARPWDILLPSIDNLFYGPYFQNIFPIKPHSTEGIMYPGLLVFIGIGLYMVKRDRKYIPLLLTILAFYILSWGPIIALGKTGIPYLNNINIPLPDIILQKLPILSMMRVPSRYGMIIAFIGSLFSAIILQQRLKQFPKLYLPVCLTLLLIFLIDQSYQIPIERVSLKLPTSSYNIIKQDPNGFSFMQLPFTIRDGFNYLGKIDALEFHFGQLLTEKPIIGGYLSRVGIDKFEYYYQNPALHYFLSSIDDPPKNVLKPDNQILNQNLSDLSVKYILIRNDYQSLKEVVSNLKYKQIIEDDNGFSLYRWE